MTCRHRLEVPNGCQRIPTNANMSTDPKRMPTDANEWVLIIPNANIFWHGRLTWNLSGKTLVGNASWKALSERWGLLLGNVNAKLSWGKFLGNSRAEIT